MFHYQNQVNHVFNGLGSLGDCCYSRNKCRTFWKMGLVNQCSSSVHIKSPPAPSFPAFTPGSALMRFCTCAAAVQAGYLARHRPNTSMRASACPQVGCYEAGPPFFGHSFGRPDSGRRDPGALRRFQAGSPVRTSRAISKAL